MSVIILFVNIKLLAHHLRDYYGYIRGQNSRIIFKKIQNVKDI